MEWMVRDTTDADADRLALIGGATFLETFAGVLDGSAIVEHCRREHSPATYSRYLAASAQAWLAEADGGQAPVGYALLGTADLPGAASDGTDLELKRIYALSRFHGSGIGAALLHRATSEAARRDAARLLLGVYAGNARALAFYAKNGFKQIADRRFRVGDRDYDDVVLAKMLT